MSIKVAKLLTAGAFLFACLFMAATARSQEKVDVALVLAVDHSSSVDPREWQLQLQGYAEAFRSEFVKASIVSGREKKVAVTMFRWSNRELQEILVPWTVLSSADDADRFADAIWQFSAIPYLSGTCISSAMAFAGGRLEEMPFEARRHVIDVSGDEPEACDAGEPPARDVRDMLVQKGIQINGLPIVGDPVKGYVQGVPYQSNVGDDTTRFYRENVIGGPGAFLVVAKGFENFGEAVEMKLMLELSSLQ